MEMRSTNVFDRQALLFLAAFGAIYIIWGSTYLAIKYAIETLPPFLMAGTRFLFAGSVLYLWARFSADYEKPEPVHWRTSFIVGTLLLLGGNGGVVLAQHYIPSSLAALLIATEPFWIVLLSWLWLRRARPNGKAVLGLLIGFIGVWLLISGQASGSAFGTGDSRQLLGTLLVIASACSWAVGSLYGLRAPVPKSSLMTAGMQMLSGGFVLLMVGILRGEWVNFDVATVSTNSWLGLLYLAVFGSLVGFTAYSWLLKNATPARVSTYAYVNPVVAVLLGWAVAGESFTTQMLLGAGVIIGSVALISSEHKDDSDFGEKTEVHESHPPGDCYAASA